MMTCNMIDDKTPEGLNVNEIEKFSLVTSKAWRSHISLSGISINNKFDIACEGSSN